MKQKIMELVGVYLKKWQKTMYFIIKTRLKKAKVE